MNIRPLHLLVPVLVLAAGYFAWDAGVLRESPRNPAAATVLPAEPAADNTRIAQLAAETESNPQRRAVAVEKPADPGCEMRTMYLPMGDGTVTELVQCVAQNAVEKHPYERYSNAALESLAYSDAKAAEILGVRLRDRDEAKAMSLMLRASALSGGDTAPILHYFHIYPHPHAVDGVPVPKVIRTKFVLSAVADLLGGDTFYAALWEDRVRQYSPDPDAEIAELYEQAIRIIEEMRQIELQVTGSSTIGGQGDA